MRGTTMPLARPTIHDDRRRRVPLLDHEWRARSGDDPQRAARLRRAALPPHDPPTGAEIRRAALWGLAALPVLLLGALAPAYLAFGLGPPSWVTIIASVPIGAVPALMTVFLVRRVAAARIARVYRRAGYCASCGYDLGSIPAGGDGLRVCPECGAAWRCETPVARQAGSGEVADGPGDRS